MQVKAIAMNDTQAYNIATEDRAYIQEVRTVYAYTPELGVYLCELTPSHELHYLYTYLVLSDDASDEQRDELDSRYCYEGGEDTYMHCRASIFLTAKDCGEFESMDDALEYLRGNCPL